MAPSLGVELVSPVNLREVARRARPCRFGAPRRCGCDDPQRFIVDLIIALAARHRSGSCALADAGGLISYGADLRTSTSARPAYVDRILKGEKPADLPVQGPTNTNSSSTSRPPRLSASTIPPTLLAAPTR